LLNLYGRHPTFFIAIVWQATRLKGWRNRCHSSERFNKVLVWTGIFVNLLISPAIVYLPKPLGAHWDALRFMRPDIAVPLIVIAAILACFGLFKAVRSLG